jgi:hypothetical protein
VDLRLMVGADHLTGLSQRRPFLERIQEGSSVPVIGRPSASPSSTSTSSSGTTIASGTSMVTGRFSFSLSA